MSATMQWILRVPPHWLVAIVKWCRVYGEWGTDPDTVFRSHNSLKKAQLTRFFKWRPQRKDGKPSAFLNAVSKGIFPQQDEHITMNSRFQDPDIEWTKTKETWKSGFDSKAVLHLQMNLFWIIHQVSKNSHLKLFKKKKIHCKIQSVKKSSDVPRYWRRWLLKKVSDLFGWARKRIPALLGEHHKDFLAFRSLKFKDISLRQKYEGWDSCHRSASEKIVPRSKYVKERTKAQSLDGLRSPEIHRDAHSSNPF